jgi:chromate transporter
MPNNPTGGAGAASAVAAAPSVAGLFAAFLRLGCTSFGGGTAGWLYRDIVLRRRWIDDPTFLADLALGQALPGSNGIKLAVLIGQRLHGAAGATAALSGLLAAPFVIVLAVAALYAGIAGYKPLHDMLDGVAAVVIALTCATGLRSAVHGAPGPVGLTLAAVTVLCIGILGWPMIPVVLCLAPVSIGLAFVQPRRR